MAKNMRDSFVFTDFTVWVDGKGKFGTVNSFTPPKLELATEDFRGGGMDASVAVPFGINALDFDFRMHVWDEHLFGLLGFGPGQMNIPIVFRGYQVTPEGSERPVLIRTRSLIKSIDGDTIEPGKKTELSISCNANYYRHTVDGVVVNEVDVFAKVAIIGGVDRSANARRLLGFAY